MDHKLGNLWSRLVLSHSLELRVGCCDDRPKVASTLRKELGQDQIKSGGQRGQPEFPAR